MQSSTVSPWLLKLGIRRELGLYADSIAKRGAHYFFYAWELPVGGFICVNHAGVCCVSWCSTPTAA
jgi:hypothetical protein